MNSAVKKRKRKRRINFGRKEIIFLLLILSIILGIIWGIWQEKRIDSNDKDRLSAFINQYVYMLDSIDVDSLDFFLNSFFKYGRIMLIVWFAAFMPPGIIVVMFILALRSSAFIFTNIAFISQLGFKGFLYCFKLFYLQNLIYGITLIYISFHSIYFAVNSVTEYRESSRNRARVSLRQKNKFKIKYLFTNPLTYNKVQIKNHLFVLCIGVIGVFFASAVEGYIVKLFF